MKTRKRTYTSPIRLNSQRKNDAGSQKVQNELSSSSNDQVSLDFNSETKNLFRQTRYRFKRRRIRCFYPYEILFSDSIVYRQYSRYNSGFKYIVVVVDCFSKMAFAEAVKKLDEFSVALALERIFKRMPESPRYFCTDRGTEFLNSKVKDLMQRQGIIHYTMRGPHKASIAERFIRTLKTQLEKYFWQYKTRRWLDVFQRYISRYNSTYHRSIKMRPDEVTLDNRQKVFRTLFPEAIDRTFPRLSIGQKVRLVKYKSLIEKGYTRRWSLELYKIVGAESRNFVDFYKISDLEGNILPGSKYYWELNPVKQNARLRRQKRRLGNSKD